MTHHTGRGRQLARRWGLRVAVAYYHQDGHFFHTAEAFPVACCDPQGYLLFRTRADYEGCAGLRRGVRVNVPGGIATVPGYRRMR